MIEYRFLTENEYDLVADRIQANGGDPITPAEGLIAAAIEDGHVVGFCVLHWIPNLAMHIDPEFRGKVKWQEFQRMIERILDHEQKGAYYVFPSDDRVAKLCQRGGMTRLPQPVYRRDL